jgi:glycosidase
MTEQPRAAAWWQDFLDWLGVDAIWIWPIFPSPVADFGYDVSNYNDHAYLKEQPDLKWRNPDVQAAMYREQLELRADEGVVLSL